MKVKIRKENKILVFFEPNYKSTQPTYAPAPPIP